MRSWLTYIFLLMAACGALLTSCNDVLGEEGTSTCDDRTTVRLTISFGGDSGAFSRDVDSPTADDDLDYTTDAQAEIVTGDIYALVVDASTDKFLYRITDLKITEEPAEDDDYYTRTLEGTMIQTNQQVKIVLLANLIQDGIITVGTDAVTNKAAVEAIIDNYKGQAISNLYNALVYNYDGATTPWTLSGDNARRIPMWGQSQATTVPPATDVTLTCYLYRALAKVQIWVNDKEGIDGFVINSITVNDIHKKGYCVSQATNFDTDGPNYDVDNDGDYEIFPYTSPSVPTDPGSQTVTYSSLNVDKFYSDMIYLPEQVNIGATTPVTITVNYTYNNTTTDGTIKFQKDGTGAAFDVIRNHSYVFNIMLSETDAKLYYTVEDMPEVTVNIPAFE